MRKFRATTLQDGSSIPWAFELPPVSTAIPLWGVNIVPRAVYASYDENYIGQGEILHYEWSAFLDPADTPLPNWITETTPVETTTP
jgi:hypothetical protein